MAKLRGDHWRDPTHGHDCSGCEEKKTPMTKRPTCDTPGCGRPIPKGGEGHPEICPVCLACLQLHRHREDRAVSCEERRDDEPDDDPPGQCDWGYCDKLATQWRWLERFGWLPICDGCAWLADSRQALDWTEH